MHFEYSLRSLLTVLFRQKFKFLLVFALIAGLGFAYLKNMESPYQAHGSFLVKFGQGALTDTLNPSRTTITQYSENDRDEILQSYVKILYSTSLLSDVVTAYGSEKIYPDIKKSITEGETANTKAVEQLQQKHLKVHADLDSNVVDIYLKNQNPKVAQEITKLLMDTFIQKQSEVYNAPQSDFLKDELAKARHILNSAQAQLRHFKQQNNLADLDKEMERLIIEKSELSTVAFQAVNEAQANLDELENELAQKQTTYKSTSQALKKLNNQISAAKQQLRQRQEDLNAGGDEGSSFSSKIAAINERIAYLETNRAEYDDHKQRVDSALENYEFYQKQSEQARLQDVLAQQSFSRIVIVDEPKVPEKPMPVNKKLLFIAILIAAGSLGLGVVIVFEIMDESVSDPRQITKSLGLPVLASFPPIKKGSMS